MVLVVANTAGPRLVSVSETTVKPVPASWLDWLIVRGPLAEAIFNVNVTNSPATNWVKKIWRQWMLGGESPTCFAQLKFPCPLLPLILCCAMIAGGVVPVGQGLGLQPAPVCTAGV